MGDLSNENVVYVRKDGVEYLQFSRLLKCGVTHAYGLMPGNFKTVGDGVDGKQIDNALECYRKLCKCLWRDYRNIVIPLQKHNANVKSVGIDFELDVCKELVDVCHLGVKLDRKPILKDVSVISSADLENTDGLITNKKNVILASTNADCILLLFYDPVKKVIANVHSGWKGTFQKISVNAFNKMVEDYGCNPGDIICCICPSIRKCHFEVEDDVKNLCVEKFEYTGRLDDIIESGGIKDGKNKWMIDTVLINRIILCDAGLKDENIVDCGICSVCNCDKVHSYRVEGTGYGVCTAVIGLD